MKKCTLKITLIPYNWILDSFLHYKKHFGCCYNHPTKSKSRKICYLVCNLLTQLCINYIICYIINNFYLFSIIRTSWMRRDSERQAGRQTDRQAGDRQTGIKYCIRQYKNYRYLQRLSHVTYARHM